MKFKTVNGLEVIYVSCINWNLLSSVGVWLFLDDRVFNQDRVKPFEKALRTNHHAYYYCLDQGIHYDQFEIFQDSKRIRASAFLELSLEPVSLQMQQFTSFPFHRRAQDSQGLRGDFLSFSQHHKESIKVLEN
jgi:hypothetical protein